MTPVLAAKYLLIAVMCVLSVTMLLCLLRTFLGPRASDRIVAVNMLSTQIVIFICVLAVYLGEEALADIALLYAMIGFLAVVVVAKLRISAYAGRQRDRQTATPRNGEESR